MFVIGSLIDTTTNQPSNSLPLHDSDVTTMHLAPPLEAAVTTTSEYTITQNRSANRNSISRHSLVGKIVKQNPSKLTFSVFNSLPINHHNTHSSKKT